MTNIWFKLLSAANSFWNKKGDSISLSSSDTVICAREKTNQAGIDILLISRELEKGKITGICLVSNPNNRKYPIDEATESISKKVNTLLGEIKQPQVNVLAYNFWWQDETSLWKPQHRAFFILDKLRWKWAWKLLHKTMDRIDWEHKQEFTFVPSLLMFYIKQGFSISAIHMRVEWEEDLIKYDNLSEQQKQIIYNSILLTSEYDFSLPFYVELEKTKVPSQYENENICPEVLIDFLGEKWLTMNNDGSRYEPRLSKDEQGAFEIGFQLDPRSWIKTKVIFFIQR